MSPYENRLNAENFRRVALIATVPTEGLETLRAALAQKPTNLTEALASKGVHNLEIYEQCFDARHILFIYFEMDELDQELAAQVLKRSSPWFATLEPHLTPHPRALTADLPWQRAEFINIIADNTHRQRERGKPAGLAAGLHPDKELWYRTLHQTNWPGVIDQMARSHYQNWTTFMLEFDDDLMLFTYVEYLGTDQSADDTLMQADPVTNRWWKHTEPCLYSIVKDGSNWTPFNCHK